MAPFSHVYCYRAFGSKFVGFLEMKPPNKTNPHTHAHAHSRTITRTNNRKSYEKKRKTITNYDIISIVILTLFRQLRWLLLMQCPFVSDFLLYSWPIPLFHTTLLPFIFHKSCIKIVPFRYRDSAHTWLRICLIILRFSTIVSHMNSIVFIVSYRLSSISTFIDFHWNYTH